MTSAVKGIEDAIRWWDSDEICWQRVRPYRKAYGLQMPVQS